MSLLVALTIFLAAAPPTQLQRLQQHARPTIATPLHANPCPKEARTTGTNSSRSFTISNDRFMKDGVPFRLVSGSLHYNRIPPDLWADRLARAKAMGLNAVQFYVPWNFHQPRPGPEGVLPFEGWHDVARFITTAGDMGLLVLLRPGPYICAGATLLMQWKSCLVRRRSDAWQCCSPTACRVVSFQAAAAACDWAAHIALHLCCSCS
jgi:hypothetical protein